MVPAVNKNSYISGRESSNARVSQWPHDKILASYAPCFSLIHHQTKPTTKTN